MNKVFINLVPIVVGGGLQNAINFLINLDAEKLNNDEFLIIIRNDTSLIKVCDEKGYQYTIIDNGFLSRLKFELFFFIGKQQSIIFTLFGTKPILSWGARTITGCAYSNLFYPKIDFWGYLPFTQKEIKKLKDFYRYINVKSSDVVIFETELLTQKAVREFSFPRDDTYTVKMAVSSLVTKGSTFIDFNISKNKFTLLYLGSAHPNKRQHLLPELVKSMLAQGVDDFCIVLTMDKKNAYTKKLINLISDMRLKKYFLNLGSVENNKVANLIEQCDAMINIAKLESFSNNFVEAWQMEKVLFVTDDEWARDSCGNAAVYLNVEDNTSMVSSIKKIMDDRDFYENIVEEGKKQLCSYPNPKQKIMQFIEIINSYIKKG